MSSVTVNSYVSRQSVTKSNRYSKKDLLEETGEVSEESVNLPKEKIRVASIETANDSNNSMIGSHSGPNTPAAGARTSRTNMPQARKRESAFVLRSLIKRVKVDGEEVEF